MLSIPAWSLSEGENLVKELFVDVFNTNPDGVYSAPGRVNIIGEHTDYNDGLALPIAIPHRAYLAVKKRTDRIFRLADEEKEMVELNLDEIDVVGTPGEVKNWAAYVAGVLWALEEIGLAESGSLPGFDVVIRSCVPRGGGLSSSAAIECSMAAAADDTADLGYLGSMAEPNDSGREKVVRACIEAENKIAGAPTGGLDQSASLRCLEGHAIALDCESGKVTNAPFDLASSGITILVIDTRAPHSLNDGQYAKRRTTCEESAKALGVKSLRKVADQVYGGTVDLDSVLAQLPSKIHQKRTQHVVTEIIRTWDFIDVLKKCETGFDTESLRKIGQIMNASHDSLREDYEVTCPELDLTVDVARKHGAIGARMTGGGFGGSAIALIKAEDQQLISEEIADAYAKAGFREPAFLVATPSKPAGKH